MSRTDSNEVLLNTPLGALSFRAQCDAGTIGGAAITVHDWAPSLPNGMSVEGCKVIVFKYKPSEPLKKISFLCEWVDLNITGYSNSGEALDAWEWESDKHVVVVGTEDSDGLNSRLQIETEYMLEDWPISMKNNKISIRIAGLDVGRELTLHYVVAWNSLPEPKDSSCWFAVDVPHLEILEVIK